MASLQERVTEAVRVHPAIQRLELIGSRGRGDPMLLSDWDFMVETNDFEAVASELPGLTAVLRPLVSQWDPLSEYEVYMLVLPGPHKVDFLFDVPSRPVPRDPVWAIDERTLPEVDGHFWDWILWLAEKVQRGSGSLVAAELAKMHHHLLGPLGVEDPPAGIEDAVSRYRRLRTGWTERLGVMVPAALGEEVTRGLRAAGFEV